MLIKQSENLRKLHQKSSSKNRLIRPPSKTLFNKFQSHNRENFISHRAGSLVLREISLFLRGASDQIGMKPYILGVSQLYLCLH